jgi:hypothetical protein
MLKVTFPSSRPRPSPTATGRLPEGECVAGTNIATRRAMGRTSEAPKMRQPKMIVLTPLSITFLLVPMTMPPPRRSPLGHVLRRWGE